MLKIIPKDKIFAFRMSKRKKDIIGLTYEQVKYGEKGFFQLK